MWNRIIDFFRSPFFESTRVWYYRNPGFSEVFLGIMRLLLLILFFVMFILAGGEAFQQIDARSAAIYWRNTSPLLHLIPLSWLTFVIYIFAWENLRYALPVAGALISLGIAGANYVKDIYNIKQFRDALHYVLSSMFVVGYPHINIDKGEAQVSKKKINLIQEIGGPGFAQIQPGNAVLFRKLRQVSRNIITRSVLMTRFETIGTITNLDDQDGTIDDRLFMTRDGILVKVRNARFRYRILSEVKKGQPVPRSPERPYPFSEEAFINMSYALPVNEEGQTSWGQAVSGQVAGVIEEYVSSHTIDHLTAPRNHQRDPREEIRQLMFGPGLTRRLRDVGTQLLWVDIGHFEIVAEEVDRERFNLWAAEWQGRSSVSGAEIAAKRMANQDLGRAEGQAEMLVGIARALQTLELGENRPQNIRKLMLTRVAQILDAIRDSGYEEPPARG